MQSTFLHFADCQVEVLNFHDNFLLLRAGDGEGLQRIGNALYQRKFEFVEEVIVTEMEVCVQLNTRFKDSDLARLVEVDLHEVPSPRTFTLPVFFDEHPDWKQVEAHTGFPRQKVIEDLTTTPFSLAMFGFLPGYLYLNGLPEALYVPRKAIPAKYVKAGSVAIGGKYLGVYALDSPGGWNVIGTTPLKLLEVPELPPVSMIPGDKVRLQPIAKPEFDRLQAHPLTLSQYNARP